MTNNFARLFSPTYRKLLTVSVTMSSLQKLNTYGFDRNALKLIYLSDRSQKTKAGSLFRAYLDIIYRVPQVVYHLYFANFANFADDTTYCECGPTLNEVMNNLETTTQKMFEWFSFNNLKANASKCHLFLSPYQPVSVNIKGSIIESSNCEKLLGIYTDSNFTDSLSRQKIQFRNFIKT